MSQRQPREPLPPVHSLAEAGLYVRVTPCRLCAGPLDRDEARFRHDSESRVLSIATACRTCGTEWTARLDASEISAGELTALVDGPLEEPWDFGPAELNPDEAPSRIIDLAGWLTLFTWIADSARLASEQARTTDERARVRRMRTTAAACLDEALRFFEDDHVLPPDEAFFHDAGRRQFWERPELFTRQHIADLRFSLLRSGHG